MKAPIPLAMIVLATTGFAGESGPWREALDSIPSGKPDRFDAEGLRLAREIIEKGARKLPAESRITGEWKIRSIQGGPDGVVVYPWFDGGIVTTDRPQELAFAKSTGSQRRGGKLLPAQSEDFMVFLGGRQTDFTGQMIYSTLDDTVDAPRLDSDSGGVFFFVGSDRAVMVLDVTSDSWEIYEMRRSGDEGGDAR